MEETPDHTFVSWSSLTSAEEWSYYGMPRRPLVCAGVPCNRWIVSSVVMTHLKWQEVCPGYNFIGWGDIDTEWPCRCVLVVCKQRSHSTCTTYKAYKRNWVCIDDFQESPIYTVSMSFILYALGCTLWCFNSLLEQHCLLQWLEWCCKSSVSA